MNDNEIIDKIRAKYPDTYPGDKINTLISSLKEMSPVIKRGLASFLETGNHEEITLLGYSVEKLNKDAGMNEIAAYLTLDWIVREPDKAVSSLRRGHDVVKVGSSE